MYRWTWCDARLDYRLTVETPLHIGGGKPNLRTKRDNDGKQRGRESLVPAIGEKSKLEADLILPIGAPDEVNAPERWRPYMPGSSLRGAIRSHLHDRTDRAMDGRSIDPAYTQDNPDLLNSDDDTRGENNFHFGNALIRHLFGTTARRGALEFSAATLIDGGLEHPQYSNRDLKGEQLTGRVRVLTQNRLDRFSMASTDGLRNIAAIEAGSVFRANIVIRSFGWWQLGAIALAFHDACAGNLSFGSRGAAGLGRARIAIDKLTIRWRRDCAPGDDEQLWPGVGAILARHYPDGIPGNIRGSFGEHGQMFLLDPKDELAKPNGVAVQRCDDSLTTCAEVPGETAENLLRAASQRLAALAGHISSVEGAA